MLKQYFDKIHEVISFNMEMFLGKKNIKPSFAQVITRTGMVPDVDLVMMHISTSRNKGHS